MLKFVPDSLRTKWKCNYVVRKLPFVIRYIPNQYSTENIVIKLLEKPL